MKNVVLAIVALGLMAGSCDTPPTPPVNNPPVSNTPVANSNNSNINTNAPLNTNTPTTPPKEKPKAQSSCDPNYSGCVPIASDVDCAGGSGNGPAYTGRVNVIGSDIYDLDRDGDGVACE